MMRIGLALLVGMLFVGPALAGDKEDIEAQVKELMQAVNAGDAAAVAAFYADDAAILPPDSETVWGKDDILSLWQDIIDSGTTNLELRTTDLEVFGKSAQEVGIMAFDSGTDADVVSLAGKYIVLWHKGGDGSWKIWRHIWNYDSPAVD